ncbi:MAG: prepilin-type N-terminal cleavage/methylation domain-containing protein [Alphaproteobacteria bacterium]
MSEANSRANSGGRGAMADRSWYGSRRSGFTLLEVLGALSVALILLLTLFWARDGAEGSFRDRVVERQAQYLAGVMRTAFEAELENLQSDHQVSLFLEGQGLLGDTLSTQAVDVVADATKVVPPAGYNLSSRTRENGASIPTAMWLQREGLLPTGIAAAISADAIETSQSTTDVPIEVFFGRIRPDALVAGLCGPRFRNVLDSGNTGGLIDSDGDGTSGNCGDTNSRDREPDFGYRPLARDARIDADDINTTDVSAPNQLIYPFSGYYETTDSQERNKVVVTDDTLLALVVKTKFDLDLTTLTATSLAGSRHTAVMRRAAELLAPYGGWGILEDSPSDFVLVGPDRTSAPLPASSFASVSCLPHITDVARSPRTATGCVPAARALYTATNGAIVSPHLSWRFLWRELPVLDPDNNPGLASVPGTVPGTTVSSVNEVPGQLFMIALLGRRSNAQLTLLSMRRAGLGATSTEVATGETNIRFTGRNGLVDAPAGSFRPGRNWGFVFARDVNIRGDLIVDSDAIIEGTTIGGTKTLSIPSTDLVVEGGHFSASSPHSTDTGTVDILVLEGARLDRLEFVDPN